MANDFKRICTPSIGTSLTTIYAVPAGASSAALESIVIGITMANKTTSGVTASIWIDNEDGSNADNLEALASSGSAVDVTVSVLEDV